MTVFCDDTMGLQIDKGHHYFLPVKCPNAGTVKNLFLRLFIDYKKGHRL
jgi:hypothetical protein